MAAYAKLRDGSWGLSGAPSELIPGQQVNVTTRGGRTRQAIVGRVIWTSDDRTRSIATVAGAPDPAIRLGALEAIATAARELLASNVMAPITHPAAMTLRTALASLDAPAAPSNVVTPASIGPEHRPAAPTAGRWSPNRRLVPVDQEGNT